MMLRSGGVELFYKPREALAEREEKNLQTISMGRLSLCRLGIDHVTLVLESQSSV